MSDRMRGF